MASNSFKVKNSLVLTPKDLSTLTSPEAGDLACDINDSNKIKRYDAASASWVEVGSGGGVGGVDIFFVQDFESASLSSFTQTGLSLSQTEPLKGKVSAVLTHQAAVNQSFKQVIPVDRKFRGQTMVLRLDAKSSASAGNLVIKITNETASTDLVASEQLEISNDVNGAKSSVSFTIPESCASLSYTITALPQSGSPVSRIDDIICELASTALLETAVEVPVVTAWQGYTPTFQGFGTPTNVEFEWRQVGENVEIRGKFTSGTTTSVEARVGLPAGLTSAGTSLIPSLQAVGVLVRGASQTGSNYVLIEPSVTYTTFSLIDGANAGLTKQNANNIVSTGNSISFFASVPCAGLSATTTKTIPLTQSGLVQEADSTLRMSNATVSGNVISFSNTVESIGSDVSYSSGLFTIQTSGIYSIGAVITLASLDNRILITKNSTTTSVSNSSVLSWGATHNTGGYEATASWTGPLVAGDIIRFITPNVLGTSDANQKMFITRQGSLKQVSVNPNSKITIPTSELRMEGASSRGSTATVIARFDNVAKLRGDAFTVESDSVLGTRITMKKAGILSVNSTLYYSNVGYSRITRNQSSLTTLPTSSSEILAASGALAASSPLTGVSWTGNVAVGDVIRISTDVTPTSSPANSLNLSFQEQEIAVSVSNVLPQFSESDLVVRAAGNAGQSVTANVTNIPFQTSFDSTGGAWNGSQFTVSESGVYAISGSVRFSSSAVRSLDLYIDGSNTRRLIEGGSFDTFTFSHIDSYSAGQIISIRSNTSATLANSTASHYLNITKVGKPNVTGVDVTPFVNVPQPVTESIDSNTINTTFGSTNTAIPVIPLSRFTNNGVIAVESSAAAGTSFRALKRCTFIVNAQVNTSAGAGTAYITKNSTSLTTGAPSAGSIVNRQDCTSTADEISASTTLEAGDVIRFHREAATINNFSYISIIAEALSDQILTAPETFSTDTASLQYASSSQYTLSTLSSAPVGTYITFTYAANTNTRTQTTTRPTQTDADMNANGILLYTRVYNAASSAAQPSTFAIQIGKGLKGKSIDLYKTAGKITAGTIDWVGISSNINAGLQVKDYNELTGILLIDAGYNRLTTYTEQRFYFSDLTEQTSGYLVINASKNPALTGLGLGTVAARGVNSSGQSLPASSVTTVTYDANKTYDTHGALNTSTGVFTAPESGYYHVSAQVYFSQQSYPANTEMYCQLMKNGVLHVYGYTWENEALVTAGPTSNISTGIYLTKGDTVRIDAWNGRASATPLLASAAGSYFSIHKISLGTGN